MLPARTSSAVPRSVVCERNTLTESTHARVGFRTTAPDRAGYGALVHSAQVAPHANAL